MQTYHISPLKEITSEDWNICIFFLYMSKSKFCLHESYTSQGLRIPLGTRMTVLEETSPLLQREPSSEGWEDDQPLAMDWAWHAHCLCGLTASTPCAGRHCSISQMSKLSLSGPGPGLRLRLNDTLSLRLYPPPPSHPGDKPCLP